MPLSGTRLPVRVSFREITDHIGVLRIYDILRYTVSRALGYASNVSPVLMIQNYPRYCLTSYQAIENYFSVSSQSIDTLMIPNSDYYRVILSESIRKDTLFLKLKRGVMRIQELCP